MRYTLTKKERLKHHKRIEELFVQGQSLFSHPIKLVWSETKDTSSPGIQVSFSASKRKFKKAVDRNRIKRLMREAYRKNKPGPASQQSFSIMYIYVGNQIENHSKIEKAMITLTKLFNRSVLQ